MEDITKVKEEYNTIKETIDRFLVKNETININDKFIFFDKTIDKLITQQLLIYNVTCEKFESGTIS